MTNDALLNGQVILLSDTEVTRAADFHKNRYAFAFMNNTIVFNNNPNDDRDHQHWLLDEFGISPVEFENIPRGYMKKDRIQLFVGSNFSPIDKSILTRENISILLAAHHKRYASKVVPIYNGVRIGKVGDIWPPVETIGVFNTYRK